MPRLLVDFWQQDLHKLLGLLRPGKISRRFRNLRGPRRCPRFYARVLDLVKSTGREIDQMDTHLRLILNPHYLCLLVGLQPLQFNHQTIPIRSGFRGNTPLLHRAVDIGHRTALLVSATLLLELRIHPQGSPISSTTLTSLTQYHRVTRDPGSSHPPISW